MMWIRSKPVSSTIRSTSTDSPAAAARTSLATVR